MKKHFGTILSVLAVLSLATCAAVEAVQERDGNKMLLLGLWLAYGWGRAQWKKRALQTQEALWDLELKRATDLARAVREENKGKNSLNS